MTEQTDDKTNDDNPLRHSKWLKKGIPGALGAIGVGLFGMFAWIALKCGRLGDDERDERDRERLDRERLDLMKEARAVERAEELHERNTHWIDVHIETQRALQRQAQLDRQAKEAEIRRHRAEEDYWKAKLEMMAPAPQEPT